MCTDDAILIVPEGEEQMKLRNRYVVAGASLTLFAGLATALTASPASAGCGTNPKAALEYYYYNSDGISMGVWTRNCSGDYPLNSRGDQLYAHGWSGIVVFSDTTTQGFCDSESYGLGGKRVTRIIMSANKVTHCQ